MSWPCEQSYSYHIKQVKEKSREEKGSVMLKETPGTNLRRTCCGSSSTPGLSKSSNLASGLS